MSLAVRRFPDRIVRRRPRPGDRDHNGEWVPGAVQEVELRASVQPVRLEDFDEASGLRLEDTRRVYVPAPGALVAARDQNVADDVVIDGDVYRVQNSESWRGHTRALLVRTG